MKRGLSYEVQSATSRNLLPEVLAVSSLLSPRKWRSMCVDVRGERACVHLGCAATSVHGRCTSTYLVASF
eukprot:scaffold193993_cov35-Tisochrysis_lutea.AAC.5